MQKTLKAIALFPARLIAYSFITILLIPCWLTILLHELALRVSESELDKVALNSVYFRLAESLERLEAELRDGWRELFGFGGDRL